VPAGRDDGDTPTRLHVFANEISVIAAIRQQDLWRRAARVDDRSIAGVVGRLAAGDLGGYGQAVAIGAQMDLGREATFRAPETLAMSPPLAPAAQ